MPLMVPQAWSSLSFLQRVVLATDGTVGRILEEHAGERTQVVKLAQSLGPLSVDDRLLDAPASSTVLARTVLLEGMTSGTRFLFAESAVLADALDPDLLDRLISSDVPLGRLFCDHRLETFRELLTWGQEPAGSIGEHFGVEPEAVMMSRTYRIVAGGRPIVLIIEKFPVQGALS
ncbi:MAG: chorismate--pyruvate lyase family protein [Acidimicrobiales bacterium]